MARRKKASNRKQNKTIFLITLSILAVVTVLAIFASTKSTVFTQYAAEPKGRFIEKEINYDGENRTYKLRLPYRYNPRRDQYPVVFFLHGGGQDAEKIDRITKHTFPPLANKDRAILIYPNGLDNKWNDGNVGERRSTADDVGFLTTLLNQIVDTYSVDPKKIYFVGASNGGQMVSRMICERSEQIAAGVMIVASIPEDVYSSCQPSTPVSVMMINGTDDPIIPYQGGDVKLTEYFLTGARTIAVEDAFAFWSEQIGGKTQDYEKTNLQDTDPDDGTTVERWSVKGDDDLEAILYRIVGGGHTWPQGTQYLPVLLIGRVSNEINATEIAWEFLMRHEKN